MDRRECAYCGAPATTRDHVPPRSLFPKPRPQNLITVPSCPKCNNAQSRNDELFRIALVLRDGVLQNAKATEIARSAIRGLSRDESAGLRRSILQTFQRGESVAGAGPAAGEALLYSVPLSRITAVSDRITRGLYYHHFRKRVPTGYLVTSKPASALRSTDEDGWSFLLGLVSSTSGWIGSIDPEIFRYKFERARDDPDATFWVFAFYGMTAFLSVTVPDKPY